MWLEILVVFFVGGVVGLDTTAAWQVLFSHPLLACTILGVVFGEPQLGLFFGIIFELIWLYDIPVGGAKFPEGNLSSFIGLMITITLLPQFEGSESWLVLFCIVYIVILAYLMGFSIRLMRKNNQRIVLKADEYAEAGKEKSLQRMHLLGIFHAYFHSAVWGLGFYLIGVFLLKLISSVIPSEAGFSLDHLQAVFLGIGLVIMIDLFFTRKKIKYFFLGIICGIVLGIVI